LSVFTRKRKNIEEISGKRERESTQLHSNNNQQSLGTAGRQEKLLKKELLAVGGKGEAR